MSMPEASVNENGRASAGENNIWFAGQVFHMKPVAISERMQPAPDDKLRFGVLAPDAGHHPASGSW